MAKQKSKSGEENLDVSDLSKSVTGASKSMSEMVDYARQFNEYICGAKNCLDELNGTVAKLGKNQKEVSDATQKIQEETEKIGDETSNILNNNVKLESVEQKSLKRKKEMIGALKASAGVLSDIAGSAGFGGIVDSVMDIGAAFLKGGPILGGMSILMSAVTFIWNKFVEIDQQVENIAAGLGKGGGFARGLAQSSFNISRNFASYGIDIKEAAESAVSLGKEFVNLDYVTGKNQETIALMSRQLGMSSQSASKSLSTFMSMTGGSFKLAKNYAAVAMSAAKTANLPLGAIMEDLANNSESAAKYGGKFSQSTILASAAAKKMGLSFANVAKIAEGILDIESSVEKQFEAQVLLGRNVNLEQARYYALTGDTYKLQKEVLKQVGSEAEYLKMMPMQRQALADAIGVGVEELGKMVSRQKEGKSIEEKTLELQELQQKSLDKQLVSSEKMVGIAVQIQGALTELGYAILKYFFNIDLAKQYENITDSGEKFANMISEVATQFRNGEGPLIDTINSFKFWFKVIGWVVGGLAVLKTALLIKEGFALFGAGAKAATVAVHKLGSAIATDFGPGVKSIKTGFADGTYSLSKYETSTDRMIKQAKASGASLKAYGTNIGSFIKSIGSGIGGAIQAVGSGIAIAIKVIAKAALSSAYGLGIFVLAMIGLGAALYLAAPGIKALKDVLEGVGTVVIAIGTAISKILTSAFDGISKVLGTLLPSMTLEKAAAIAAVGYSFGALAVGLGALTVSSFLTGLISFFGLGPADQLENIIKVVNKLDATKMTGLQSLSNLLYNLTSVDPSRIAMSTKALSDGLMNLKNSNIDLKYKVEVSQSTDQKNYNSESLKYLKIIAIATGYMAEKQGVNIRGGNLDSGIYSLLT